MGFKAFFWVSFFLAWIVSPVTAQMGARDTILLDLGAIDGPAPWNQLKDPAMGQITQLFNQKGEPGPVAVKVSNAFSNVYTAGTTSPHATAGLPSTVSVDGFYGNDISFEGQTEPEAELTFEGLDVQRLYSFSFFASRMQAMDSRQTTYQLIGATEINLYLEVSNNEGEWVTGNIRPSSDGTVKVRVQKGPANNNSYGFYYLGAVRISYQREATDSTQSLTLLYPNGGQYWQGGKILPIRWTSNNVDSVALSYSVNAGKDWSTIAKVPAGQMLYPWKVTQANSQKCLVAIAAASAADTSENFFTLNTYQDRCTWVVLGSSTAEGAGASIQDSAWVDRTTSALSEDSRYQIINLGRGGITSFHIMPSDFVFTGLGFPPDATLNISKAFTFNPAGIIVNMPSNDAANYLSAADQMANFKWLQNVARLAGVQFWITTSQPRNFADTAQIAIQRQVKDAILDHFGDRAIDLWSPLADARGWILSEYDSGDGVHLNDKGHRLIHNLIMASVFNQRGCVVTTEQSPETEVAEAVPNSSAVLKANGRSQAWELTHSGTKIGPIALEVKNEKGGMLNSLTVAGGKNTWPLGVSTDEHKTIEVVMRWEDGSQLLLRASLK
jgi:lysophospholipase L1-like esterase